MRLSVLLYFLLPRSSDLTTPAPPSRCPHHDKVWDDTFITRHSAHSTFVNVYLDRNEALLDRFPHKFIKLDYKPLTGLKVAVYVRTDNYCPSVMLLIYNFFCDYKPAYQKLCSVHREYPLRYRFRLDSDRRVGVVTWCVEATGQHSAWILSVVNETLRASLEEILITGKDLLALENITNLEFVAVDDPFSMDYQVSFWPTGCSKLCTYPSGFPSEMANGERGTLGKHSKRDYGDREGVSKWLSNVWKIVFIAILILCVFCLYVRKRFRNRNIVAVLN